jgi:hypothetical protein
MKKVRSASFDDVDEENNREGHGFSRAKKAMITRGFSR